MTTQVNIEDIVEKADKLEELTRRFFAGRSSEMSKWVEEGLMTEEDFAAYRAASNLKREAYQAGEDAKDATPRQSNAEIFSIEYNTMRRRFEELKSRKFAIEHTQRMLLNLSSERGNSNTPFRFMDEVVRDKVQDMREALKRAWTGADRDELEQLEGRVGHFGTLNRRGTKAYNAMKERADAWEIAANKNNEEAMAAVLEAHPDILKAGRLAERVMESRISDKQEAIAAEMTELIYSLTFLMLSDVKNRVA
jgi:hypothetical protein